MDTPQLKEMTLVRIKIDENRQEQVIVLKEKEGSRYLPIIIGMPEVNAIKLELSGVKPPRPLTHDLLLQTAGQLGGNLLRVQIDKLENNTFYSTLVFGKNGGEVCVDARPSDSIALALRAKTPIFSTEEVLQLSGIEE
jgi:hypothetical protein